MTKRIHIEKKKEFAAEASRLLRELRSCLELPGLKDVRVIYRYDVEGVDEIAFKKAEHIVFADPVTDLVFGEELPGDIGNHFFAMELLPGQFNEKADLAAQCLKISDGGATAEVRFAKLIALFGDLSAGDLSAVKKYMINPVESQEADLEKPGKLTREAAWPDDVEIITDFKDRAGFAMNNDDIMFVHKYFSEKENRDPTITELRAIDTYWSDHCRHTTFLTSLKDIKFEPGTEIVEEAFREYLKMREEVYGNKEKPVNLMDIACIGAKYLKKKGLLDDLDESDEVNACSIRIKADIDGKEEDWLVMFKNETHNHPTEIEPFGGASTCLGGAIRDPLSGRVYVYQAMRVTGSGDPGIPVKDTLAGKLPQRKITTEAAAGYSSYGNQIGVAAGQVTEIYDEGYIAKRMELGAVIGAAPAENVVRAKPVPGDVVILVGGRTGRDGCGGATGSSKGHTEESLSQGGAEVQKGNPALERGILRLFRRKEASILIKKCNDFGAGGVSVAVGELADAIDVNLDLIPTKYDGLDGTELAISESQERMAVVVADRDKDAFIAYATEENLEATAIAKVTDTGRFRLFWRGKAVLDISREFLDSGGITREAEVTVKSFEPPAKAAEKSLLESLTDLNNCSQKGLSEMFAGAPLAGKYQLSPAAGMAAKLPVTKGETNTITLMSYGFDPELLKASPFHGAMYAVIESVSKIAAMGGDISKIRLSFQEYFERMKDAVSWGKPFSALLGALKAQKELSLPAIGGKDSMSGTFMDINVPPTLVSFAVCVSRADLLISSEFKKEDSKIILISAGYDKNGIPDFAAYKKAMKKIRSLAEEKKILAANTVGAGGVFVSLIKMAAGNKIGFRIKNINDEKLRNPDCTALVLEIAGDENTAGLFAGAAFEELGTTSSEKVFNLDGVLSVDIEEALEKWTSPLESVFPVKYSEKTDNSAKNVTCEKRAESSPKIKAVKPGVIIPVFHGTNNETDFIRAFEKAGAEVSVHVFRNLDKRAVTESVSELAGKINESRIIMIPGGSPEFITAVLSNERIKEAVKELLENRDGLIFGVDGGFSALLKLGLLPPGALTLNITGKYTARFAETRVSSVMSPWFSLSSAGDIHTAYVSTYEGRFVAEEEIIKTLAERGQIASQYVDFEGNAAMSTEFNPGGSAHAIEAVTSPDGRILGKTAGWRQGIIDAGVRYFK